MQETKELLEKILLHGFIAFVGGTARYLSNAERPTWFKIVIEGTISSFVGLMFMFFACFISDSQYFSGVMAGLGGWLGPKGMQFLFDILKGVINKKL